MFPLEQETAQAFSIVGLFCMLSAWIGWPESPFWSGVMLFTLGLALHILSRSRETE